MTADTLTKDESIRLMQAEIERLRELVHGTIERNGKLAEENARLRGLSDITRLDVMWQELVRERYAAENNAAVLAAEVQNLRAEIERLRADMQMAAKLNLELLEIRRTNEAEIERLRCALEAVTTVEGNIIATDAAKTAEIERLREVIRLTYKTACGRNFEHMELPEAVAAARQEDADEIDRLRGLLRDERPCRRTASRSGT